MFKNAHPLQFREFRIELRVQTILFILLLQMCVCVCVFVNYYVYIAFSRGSPFFYFDFYKTSGGSLYGDSYTHIYLHSKVHLYNSFLKSIGNSMVSGSRNARIFFTNIAYTTNLRTCTLIARGCIMCGLTFERKSCHNLP